MSAWAALAGAPAVTRAADTPETSGQRFTAEALLGLSRISEPHLSPDATRIVFDLRTMQLAANKGEHAIWLIAGGSAHPLLPNASLPQWSADGTHVLALSDRSGSMQVWQVSIDGLQVRQITHLPVDVQAFRVSPDGRRLIVSLAIAPGCRTAACTADRQRARSRDKSSGVLYDRLFVRHWDLWSDGSRNRLFAVALDGQSEPVPLTPDLDADVPSKPFGSPQDFSLSPDGAFVYFSARVAGRTEPWSTNFDLWRVPITGSSAPMDLTADNPASDAEPVVSPDGSKLAWRAQRRAGFESDRFGIWIMDLQSGGRRELAPAWDRSPDQIAWSSDGRSLLATADDDGAKKLFRIDVADGAVRALSSGGSIEAFDTRAARVIVAQDAFDRPIDLWELSGSPPRARQLTHVNASALRDIAFSAAQRFSFAGWNGESVHGYVFKPFGWQPGQRYPVAFLIHGGPQGSWDDDWSYRWNPQTYTGAGYGVVLIDFHGSSGYGQAFTDSISGHWGDRPLEDLQKGWAAVQAQQPWIDGQRACALGASYGGYMIDWIAGVWNSPWKCLVAHDGVFDQRMMGYATEEQWFTTWENDHAMPWQNPAAYERFNPIDHVANWSKPILVIHSGRDFRVPLEQGIAAFTAAQSRGIESRFLYFPDENHWVLKPQNSLLWHHTVQAWLDRWLGPAPLISTPTAVPANPRSDKSRESPRACCADRRGSPPGQR